MTTDERVSDLAFPLDTATMEWIPTGPGKSFRPLRFEPDGWSELMRLEPGSFAYEPGGTVDAWRAIGDEPCVLHLKVTGTVEYVGADGQITEIVDSASQCAVYLAWCAEHDIAPAAQILSR